ncbi:hypothetical protein N9B98_04435, partial [bacterium]|nr:hypothetical protein [bacterium]
MIRANQIPITLLLTIAATCCNGQTEDSTKTGASISQSTENFATHFLQTDHLPASEQFVSPEEVKNGSFPFTDSDIRPTETSFLLPPQGLLEFEHADSFSTLGRTKTQQGTPTATGDLQQESTATVQAEPSSELNPGVVQALFDYRLTEADRNQTDFSVIDPVNFQVDDINNFN